MQQRANYTPVTLAVLVQCQFHVMLAVLMAADCLPKLLVRWG